MPEMSLLIVIAGGNAGPAVRDRRHSLSMVLVGGKRLQLCRLSILIFSIGFDAEKELRRPR